MADQWVAYEGLRVTASIVFGVVGVWFAVLYPELLQRLAEWKQPAERQARRVGRLAEPLVDSAVVVVLVSLVGLSRPLLSRLVLPPDQLELWRGGSFGLLIALTLLQLRALVGVVLPVFRLRDQLAADEEYARVRGRFSQPRPSGSKREVASAGPL
jgi:hypothetical protein